jgi:hypothetical protein
MFVYSVIRTSSFGADKEVKTFSNLVKALTFIEQEAGPIDHIKDGENFSYKKYCSEAEWAKILLKNKDLENRIYFPQKKEYLVAGYKIHKIKVY